MTHPLVTGTGAHRAAPALEARSVDLAAKIEVRHGLPALGRPLRHQPPDARARERPAPRRLRRPRRRPRRPRRPARCRRARPGRRRAPRRAAGPSARRAAAGRARASGGGDGDAGAATEEPQLRPRPRGRRRLGEALAGGEEHGDRLADRHVVAVGRPDPGERPVGRRFDLDGHLVGLDLEQRLALRDRVAFRLEPAQHLARLLRHPERRHDHVGGHQSVCAPSKRAESTTASAMRGLFRFDCVSRTAGRPPPTV